LPDLNHNNFKNLNQRDPSEKIHILIMNSNGKTRRINLSVSFIWLLVLTLSLGLFLVAFLSYFSVDLFVKKSYLDRELVFQAKYNEMKTFNQGIRVAPDEAARILEQLDQAFFIGESADIVSELVGIPEDAPDTISDDSSPEDGASSENPIANSDSDNRKVEQNPEELVWASLRSLLTTPSGPSILDVEEFKLTQDGKISFILRQALSRGTRLRGRSIVVCSVSDENGEISLKSSPEIDLTNPNEGYKFGSKYNIVSSKIVRGQIKVPPSGKILSAEILAWDEMTQELVFRKKIKIEGR